MRRLWTSRLLAALAAAALAGSAGGQTLPTTSSQCALGAKCVAVSWFEQAPGGAATAIPPARDDFVAVAAGNNHGLGLTRAGQLLGWAVQGTDVPAANVPGSIVARVTQFVTSPSASLAVDTMQQVTAWGDAGSLFVDNIPVFLTQDGSAVKVCIAWWATVACAMGPSGGITCWGGTPPTIPGTYDDMWCGGDLMVLRNRNGSFTYMGLGAVPPDPLLFNPPTLLDYLPVVDVSLGKDVMMALLSNGTTLFVNRDGLNYIPGDGTYAQNDPAYAISAASTLLGVVKTPAQQLVLGGQIQPDNVATVPTLQPLWDVSVDESRQVLLLQQTGCNVVVPSSTNVSYAAAPNITSVVIDRYLFNVTVTTPYLGVEWNSTSFRTITISLVGSTYVWPAAETVSTPTFVGSPPDMDCKQDLVVGVPWQDVWSLSGWTRVDNGSANTFNGNFTLRWTDQLDNGGTRVGESTHAVTVTFPYLASVTTDTVVVQGDNGTNSLAVVAYSIRSPINPSGPNYVDISLNIRTPYPFRHSVLNGNSNPSGFTMGTVTSSVAPAECATTLQAAGFSCSQSFSMTWTIPTATCDATRTLSHLVQRNCYSQWTSSTDPVNGQQRPCPAGFATWTVQYSIPSFDLCAGPVLDKVIAAPTATASIPGELAILGREVPISIAVTSTEKRIADLTVVNAFLRNEELVSQPGNPWALRQLVSSGAATAFGTAIGVDQGTTSNSNTLTPSRSFSFNASVGTSASTSMLNSATDPGRIVPFTVLFQLGVDYGQMRRRRAPEALPIDRSVVVELPFSVRDPSTAGAGAGARPSQTATATRTSPPPAANRAPTKFGVPQLLEEAHRTASTPGTAVAGVAAGAAMGACLAASGGYMVWRLLRRRSRRSYDQLAESEDALDESEA